MMMTYLLLGTNLGCRSAYLKTAQEHIQNEVGDILQASSIYETQAWGKKDQNNYLNQVLSVATALSPHQLLQTTSHIENIMGRTRTEHWGARIIDIDILFYEQEIVHSPSLTIPHPHIPQRRFVLTPLNAIAPQFIHPTLKKSIHDLLAACQDTLWVRKYQ